MGGGLTSEINIPLQELELKIGGGLTCERGVMAEFYSMCNKPKWATPIFVEKTFTNGIRSANL